MKVAGRALLGVAKDKLLYYCSTGIFLGLSEGSLEVAWPRHASVTNTIKLQPIIYWKSTNRKIFCHRQNKVRSGKLGGSLFYEQ